VAPKESAGQITGEHWAEKIAAEVAALIGVPHADVELAYLEGRPRCLSRRFPQLASPAATDLVHGNVLLAGFVTGYDRTKRRKQSDHTLANILNVLGQLFPDESERNKALGRLAGHMVDALILNTDRHHENWAVRRTTHPGGATTHEVAPSFDHASSLARNEPPAKLAEWLKEPWRIQWYAERATGGVYLKEKEQDGANPLKLLEFAVAKWPQYFEPWLAAAEKLVPAQLAVLVDRVPQEMMPPESREFVKDLMAFTLSRIQRVEK
jgi:HipA-like C-terminal domain